MASSEPLQTSIEERAEEKGLGKCSAYNLTINLHVSIHRKNTVIYFRPPDSASTEPNPHTDERFKSNSEVIPSIVAV